MISFYYFPSDWVLTFRMFFLSFFSEALKYVNYSNATGSSRDEAFFDANSHQWLQSDSEDDFYSVNGGMLHLHLQFCKGLIYSHFTKK